MKVSSLRALSPVDGRYAEKVDKLRDIFSEAGLIRSRVLIEIRWLQLLADDPAITHFEPLSSVMKGALNEIVDDFSMEDAEYVKTIESTTNHDLKAVEYFIRERIGDGPETAKVKDFLHFACTSEDINNLAYAMMLRSARDQVILPAMRGLHVKLRQLAVSLAGIPMLSRTHGQAASPTTLGKEMANFTARLEQAEVSFRQLAIRGKFNGAVGNFNAHLTAYPNVDWRALSQRFVESLGIVCNPYTTQIEPHDWMAEYAHALQRYNSVLLDLCRDLWGYISLGYLRQSVSQDEVGSSTMPHKVNPIDFENAEGNIGIANALLAHFAEKLPVSRFQRDLSDSTVLRNFGVAIAHVLLSVESAHTGLGKLEPDRQRIQADIAEAWEVLAEAIQTVMRCHGISEPYEKLKALTRGRAVNQDSLHEFISGLDIPDEEKARLLALTPQAYIGLAEKLAADI